MNKLVFGLAALPLMMGIASAAEPLNDVQLDQISAGDLPAIACPICISSSSNATSMTTNGVTVTSTGSSTGGGTGGSTGGSGGSTGGSSTGGTTPATSSPVVTLPANLVSIVTTTTGFAPMLH
jgi:hypothetical protein